MKAQTAQLRLLAQALTGVTLLVARNGAEPEPLPNGHDNLLNLKPGDSLTVTVQSDEDWKARQAERDARLASRSPDGTFANRDRGPAADAAGSPRPGAGRVVDTPPGQGETPAEQDPTALSPDGTPTSAHPASASRAQPDAGEGTGTVVADTGATRTRTSGGPARAPR